jgi:uncharacterized sporulation protein YeaH/YhbH (DUF444 family)
MTGRPEVVRPVTGRNPPHSARGQGDQGLYSARNQFAAIKNSREGLTTEDIVNLKREKQNLIQERSILKAKLARYANFNRHAKPPGRNQQIANSLERQVHTLEQLTAAKRAEIAQLIYSDRAAVVTELQEESKMLHLELMRLKRTKQDTENDLREISMQLQEAQRKYSPSVLNKQHKQIRALERQIAAQRARNEKIKEKVSQMKKEQEEQNYQEQNDKMQKEIESLKAKIRREHQEIAALDKQMEQMKENHAMEMQKLQSQQ